MEKTKRKINTKEYIVEKIVKHKRDKRGKYEYYLKWKNWPEESNTWEPECNLSCNVLLAEYKKNKMIAKNENTSRKRMLQNADERNKFGKKIKSEDKLEHNTRISGGSAIQAKSNVTANVAKNSRTTEMTIGAELAKETSQVEKNINKDNNGITDKSISNSDTRSEENSKKKDSNRPSQIHENSSFNTDANNEVDEASTEEEKKFPSTKTKADLIICLDDMNPLEKLELTNSLKPKKILCASQNEQGEMLFLISWEGTRGTSTVLAEEAKIRWPQHVIDFYEERMSWDKR